MTPTHTGKFRPLGRLQIEVLRCVEEHGGWEPGCGWQWDSQVHTARILGSLVGRGLVVFTKRAYTGNTIGGDREIDVRYCGYKITAAGKAENIRQRELKRTN